MGRLKTTGETTKVYPFRLNPAYEQDKVAIAIIEQKRNEGYSVRQIMTDAIVRSAGYTPEMFADYNVSVRGGFEQMLSNFAREIIESFENRFSGKPPTPDEVGESQQGVWANTLAKGFLARQQQAIGEDEE